MKIDYMGIVEKLGAELITLQPMRAKEPGGDSPGKFMVISIEGEEIRMNPVMLTALSRALYGEDE